MEKLTVSIKFVQQAYREACSEWKAKIAKEFPELFINNIEKIRELKSYSKVSQYNSVYDDLVSIFNSGRRIEIRLPNANKDWTFAVWDLAKEICEKFDMYPLHTDSVNKVVLIKC